MIEVGDTIAYVSRETFSEMLTSELQVRGEIPGNMHFIVESFEIESDQIKADIKVFEEYVN